MGRTFNMPSRLKVLTAKTNIVHQTLIILGNQFNSYTRLFDVHNTLAGSSSSSQRGKTQRYLPVPFKSFMRSTAGFQRCSEASHRLYWKEMFRRLSRSLILQFIRKQNSNIWWHLEFLPNGAYCCKRYVLHPQELSLKHFDGFLINS